MDRESGYGRRHLQRGTGRGTHTGPYGGVPATGKPVEVRDSAIWHFREGKVTEIFTLKDQFGFLKQIEYLPESVHAA